MSGFQRTVKIHVLTVYILCSSSVLLCVGSRCVSALLPSRLTPQYSDRVELHSWCCCWSFLNCTVEPPWSRVVSSALVSSFSALKPDLIVWSCRPVNPLILVLLLMIWNKRALSNYALFSNFSVEFFSLSRILTFDADVAKRTISSVEFHLIFLGKRKPRRATIIWGAASVSAF